ncbi:MAG: PepSY domain-containing protein, partial [Romboutsia timonensis]|nr:PepSY domain-containing protein [Romboutsia timonensis]
MVLKKYLILGVGIITGFGLSVVGVSYASQNLVSNVKQVTPEVAKSIMLNKVPGANILEFSYDGDDKTPKYDGTLIKDNYEYEVDVNAKTGQIIKFEKEAVFVANNNGNANNTSTNNQQATTQQNASINSNTNANSNVTTNKNTSTNVNNNTTTNKNTSANVNSNTTTNKNTSTNVNNNATTNKNTSTTNKTYIGEAKAKSIMLSKVPGATIRSFHFDIDSTPEYEAELVKDGYEYDISVNALTGAIREFSKERIEAYDDDRYDY